VKYVGKEQGDIGKAELAKMIPEQHRAFLAQLLARYGVPELPASVEATEALLGWSQSMGTTHAEVALSHPIRLLANALGPPPADVIKAAHKKDVLVAALCGTVAQAVKQREAGVDIVIASGYEAGGHTGEIGSMVLVPQVAEAVHPLPVLAAGGVASGQQMAAAMALGAQGVWTGSIWLTTTEADTGVALKQKLLQATSSDTVRSRAISGKPARQLVTEYTKAWESPESPGFLPMPLQWMATAEAQQRIYRYAETGKPGSAALVGTPVGQVVGQMNSEKSCASVISELVSGYVDAVARLHAQLHESM
jgi:NAD(P)H-dependent flavin oxidoreductase YrpB (nitropropane dioxygenase family)